MTQSRKPSLRRILLAALLSVILPGLSICGAPVGILGAQIRANPPARAERFDIILRGGRILDGSGSAWMLGDVGIRGDRIAAVGNLGASTAATTIDVTGLYVAPGFIDTHSHAAGPLETAELSGAKPNLAQGVTTVFLNPDGGGSVDLDRQRQNLLKQGLGVNAALMVPHGAVRQSVMGMADRAPSPAELQRMEQLVARGMDAGAFALSSGPFYAPGSFARTDELIALARVGARYGAPYQSHIRDESDYTIGLLAAVEEVITVARQAGVRGVVTHIKALGPGVWGFSNAIVQRVDRARSEGVEVFADQYPYDASQTSLMAALVPRWVQADGSDSTRARLADPARRARLIAETTGNLARRGGAARIRIGRYTADTTLEGKSLAEIAAARGEDPVTAALALVSVGDAGIVSFNMIESDIATLMRQPWTMTSSDGALVRAGEGVPHPRGNGAFSRKIRKYVVEDQVVDLGSAVRSMTSLPAAVYRVPDRGWIRPGAFADIAIFDLSRVRDKATYENPHQMSEGMVHVLVNGQFAVREGRITSTRAGRVLRRE